MISKIFIPIEPDVKAALLILANQELRDPRYQAAVLIRDSLIQRGFLPGLKVFNPCPEVPPMDGNDIKR
jgi:hypothetical protein